uniref:NR LBD domain-containing protein n=1 Tax=Meloidogyne incognita TaxID=6306 RepID=A0A914M1U7_MELIC
MHAFNDLDDIFLNGPILFEEIILSNFNIFRLTDTFSPNPSPIPFDELNTWESSLQRERLFNSRVQKCILVDRLLCFSIANSMPVFEKLTLSDKIAHLRHTSYLFTSFTRTYLAWELGSETWMRKNNIKPALVIMKNIVNDDKMIKWSDYVYTKSVVHFKRVALTEIEFALLIAIIFTKSSNTLIC